MQLLIKKIEIQSCIDNSIKNAKKVCRKQNFVIKLINTFKIVKYVIQVEIKKIKIVKLNTITVLCIFKYICEKKKK